MFSKIFIIDQIKSSYKFERHYQRFIYNKKKYSDTYYTIINREQSLIKHSHVNQAIWLIIIFALKHNQKTQRPPEHFYNRRSTLMTHGLPVAVAFPPVA